MAIIKCAECSGVVSTDAKRCPHCGAGKRKFKGGSKNLLIHGFVAFIAIGLLGNLLPTTEQVGDDQPSEPAKRTEQTARADVGRICKAAISLVFGQPPDTISVTGSSPVELSYIRNVDKTYWRYRCKVEGRKIIWAGYIDGQWGRWRDGAHDGSIIYRISGDKLIVSERYSDSRVSTRTFVLREL